MTIRAVAGPARVQTAGTEPWRDQLRGIGFQIGQPTSTRLAKKNGSKDSRQKNAPKPNKTPSPPAVTGPAAWMQLVRLPNVFTVLADVGAAYLLVAGGAVPLSRFVVILLAGVSLYWAGMILNDVFDVEKDSAERAERPIPSGAISKSAASRAGWGFLVVGVLLASLSGFLPVGTGTDAPATTWLPAVLAIALAVLVVAYDGPLKSTPLAPAAMGGCRVLSFLLGASPVLPLVDGLPEIPRYILAIAFGFGVYVMGITTLARDEAVKTNPINLRTGFVVILVGGVFLAIAPRFALPAERQGWAIVADDRFALLIGLILLPIATRGFRLQFDPQPAAIGNMIRVSLLTIIPLAATFAFLGAGPTWGLLVFALVVPAIGLAMRLRVT